MNITCHSAVNYLCWWNMVFSVPFLDSKWKGTYFLDSSFWIVMAHKGFFHQRLNHPQVSLRRIGVHWEKLWWEQIIHCWPPAVHVRLPALGGLQRAWPQKSFPSWWQNLSHERLINHQGLYFGIFGALGTVFICSDGFWTELGIQLSRTLTFWMDRKAVIKYWNAPGVDFNFFNPGPMISVYGSLCSQISLILWVLLGKSFGWKKAADIISVIVSFQSQKGMALLHHKSQLITKSLESGLQN